MRKGILSLSLPGHRKGSAKKKTVNMELAEQSAEAKAPVEEQPKPAVTGPEKSFVQTILVPKQPSAHGTGKRKKIGMGKPRRPRGNQ